MLWIRFLLELSIIIILFVDYYRKPSGVNDLAVKPITQFPSELDEEVTDDYYANNCFFDEILFTFVS